jgi:hypothetical protein
MGLAGGCDLVLISSARMILANTGPLTKRNSRAPVARFSSITSVPVISDGIRSGVNWIRENFRSIVLASVDMRRVFARPGTPTKRQCPRARIAIRSCSITSSCPIMTLPISDLIAWKPSLSRSTALRSLFSELIYPPNWISIRISITVSS